MGEETTLAVALRCWCTLPVLAMLGIGAPLGAASEEAPAAGASRPAESAEAARAEPGEALPAADPAGEEQPSQEIPVADEFGDEFEDELLLELEEEASGLDESDPLEPMNRGVFGANRVFDRFLFEPVARFYGWAVPEVGKRGVTNFFENLNEPVVMVNDLLQLRPRRALGSGGRFVVNTTAGVGGILDVATRLGIDGHESDFGQTLARVGVGRGAYLVLPLLGPSTLRDAVGQVVDVALRPDTWLLTPGGRLLLASTGGVAQREAVLVELEELERSSVDFYAALRSAYLMSREQMIRGELRDETPDEDDRDPG